MPPANCPIGGQLRTPSVSPPDLREIQDPVPDTQQEIGVVNRRSVSHPENPILKVEGRSIGQRLFLPLGLELS
jgi:hypothetical protein